MGHLYLSSPSPKIKTFKSKYVFFKEAIATKMSPLKLQTKTLDLSQRSY